MLDLVFENQTGDVPPADGWSEEFFRSVIEQAGNQLGLANKKIELGLYLVLPERSQELNKQYRQKDKPTDVLSFPLNEHGLEEYGILPLGDIFICLEVAQQQANEMNIPPNQELARLAVHGLLHLLGYDHELSSVEEKKMIDLQEKILETIFKNLNI
ncbi:MAG: rRNA maturation RNase YbeY [bacterium]|nr:rRNA maturation RNase YbeY [bacterium]